MYRRDISIDPTYIILNLLFTHDNAQPNTHRSNPSGHADERDRDRDKI